MNLKILKILGFLSFFVGFAIQGSHLGCPTEVAAPILGSEVLVADDDATSREFMKVVLKQMGLTAVVAHDGDEALQILERRGFQAAVLNIKMPGKSGFEVLDKIRANPLHDRMPVIAFTAGVVDYQRAKIQQADFDGFLAKPSKITSIHKALLASKQTVVFVGDIDSRQDLRESLLSRKRMVLFVNSNKAFQAIPTTVLEEVAGIVFDEKTLSADSADILSTLVTIRNGQPFSMVPSAVISDTVPLFKVKRMTYLDPSSPIGPRLHRFFDALGTP